MGQEKHISGVRAFNVRSGTPRTVGEMANALARTLNGPAPIMTGQYRLGDVRRITADSTRLRRELDCVPRMEFDAGLADITASWITPPSRVSGSNGHPVRSDAHP